MVLGAGNKERKSRFGSHYIRSNWELQSRRFNEMVAMESIEVQNTESFT
jgi:hypothetical protein